MYELQIRCCLRRLAIPNRKRRRRATISDQQKSHEPLTLSTTPVKIRVKILSKALSFIHKFRGKIVMVKYGGAVMKSEALQSSFITDLVLLSCIDLRTVFVYGGDPEINQWLNTIATTTQSYYLSFSPKVPATTAGGSKNYVS